MPGLGARPASPGPQGWHWAGKVGTMQPREAGTGWQRHLPWGCVMGTCRLPRGQKCPSLPETLANTASSRIHQQPASEDGPLGLQLPHTLVCSRVVWAGCRMSCVTNHPERCQALKSSELGLPVPAVQVAVSPQKGRAHTWLRQACSSGCSGEGAGCPGCSLPPTQRPVLPDAQR